MEDIKELYVRDIKGKEYLLVDMTEAYDQKHPLFGFLSQVFGSPNDYMVGGNLFNLKNEELSLLLNRYLLKYREKLNPSNSNPQI
ncbi:MAG: hypothetical protein A2126_02730 [Candidatus Woykebacteria bacterium GWB1_45_5]|uniref:Uncharacterized protein n=2 Tax=Candidatus Woykeibacteriota TaxID=1817899 RepID=A0A1G1W0H9_9BACT|nr:MAG: hypothetical protein A2113_00485 [Candidatus Woykebacteria bacterium GWA1_44_8]OGY24736.1 MAG: hypothetical protein A2126_02730 [Candidatus Woykebacteria bacterium GWB1_45_5]